MVGYQLVQRRRQSAFGDRCLTTQLGMRSLRVLTSPFNSLLQLARQGV
jgi:hypothetical protein